jgi:serine/threonine-protein kinase haspin
MRSFLIRGDRVCLPPESHNTAYAEGIDGPISWTIHEPYTNVLWLAYLYEWMVKNFVGSRKEVHAFKRETKELWRYLDPEADENVPGFESASDILRYAVESDWLDEDQLMGGRDEVEKSILSILAIDDVDDVADRTLRRSPRRRRPNIA